ncbi:MAG: ABC transporter ATP-binding protein [Candidatus Asgardarchaeia archaeon]
MNESEYAIEINNVSFRYPRSKEYVLKNINLKVKKGEFLLLMGPSGCGKTTLVNTINGIIPHVIEGVREGQVLVLGKEVKEVPLKNISQNVGTVFQNPETQFFTMTVEEELAFGPENLNVPPEEIKERIREAVEYVEIEDLLDKDIMSLSGGQKQRVAIASVLTMRPQILIMDEPTSDLDPEGAAEVLATIKKLNEKLNSTIILIEHRLEEVSKHVDRVIVMNNGEIIARGTPKEVFSQTELLENIGIRPPQSTQVGVELRKRGYQISNIPLTVEEAIMEIRKLINNNSTQVKLKKIELSERTQYKISEDAQPQIEIRNLWHLYPDGTLALRGINLTIHKGEFVGIIGQNGAGKSTLMSHLIGLLHPSEGYVKLYGKDVTKLPVSEIAKHIGFIFQDPDLMLFQSTVWDEIAFGPRNMGLEEEEVAKRVEEAIEMMRLKGFEKRHPHALSRGQRHRVAIASVLSMRPEILIADEPTTGQDYGATKKYLELLQRLNKQGKTIIVISHDMKTVAKYVDRVIVLRKGRILLDGPTRKIFEKVDLLASTKIEPPQITQISLNLKEFGIPTALTVEELVNAIDKLLRE